MITQPGICLSDDTQMTPWHDAMPDCLLCLASKLTVAEVLEPSVHADESLSFSLSPPDGHCQAAVKGCNRDGVQHWELKACVPSTVSWGSHPDLLPSLRASDYPIWGDDDIHVLILLSCWDTAAHHLTTE